jgi:hypothetical protein
LGTSKQTKEHFDESFNRYDVQENSGARNPTTGFHLQKVRCPHLFSEFLEGSPREPQPQILQCIESRESFREALVAFLASSVGNLEKDSRIRWRGSFKPDVIRRH